MPGGPDSFPASQADWRSVLQATSGLHKLSRLMAAGEQYVKQFGRSGRRMSPPLVLKDYHSQQTRCFSDVKRVRRILPRDILRSGYFRPRPRGSPPHLRLLGDSRRQCEAIILRSLLYVNRILIRPLFASNLASLWPSRSSRSSSSSPRRTPDLTCPAWPRFDIPRGRQTQT